MKGAMVVLLGVLVLWLAGCFPVAGKAVYQMGLKQVERPAEARDRYGEQKIEQIEEEGIAKYRFEDEMVVIVWWPTCHQVHFSLMNKTDHSIKIVWDEAAYVDPDGETHRVIHAGVKYTDANNPQPPTVIVRKGTVTDIVYPADYVYWGYRDWVEKPLFACSGNVERLQQVANGNVGKAFQVLLPLQIEDIINEYIFMFEIESVVVE